MLARIEARNQLEHTIYYCKEAAENRGSERLSELADKVALWLEVPNFLALLVQVLVLQYRSTCVAGTKVQILTQKALQDADAAVTEVKEYAGMRP